jgi:hypothetical protein
MMKNHAGFWVGHATITLKPQRTVMVAIAAFTERQALRQLRMCVGKRALNLSVTAVPCPHAWVVDLTWQP